MITRSIAFIAAFLASAAVASAHHGFGTFDLQKSVTFTGKLTRLEFINPHSWLYFEVTDANGKVTKHRCEMRSAHTLRRSGERTRNPATSTPFASRMARTWTGMAST
jgi:hypothetical protein